MMLQQISSYGVSSSNVKMITKCVIHRDVPRPRTWKILQWLQEQCQFNNNECAISQLKGDICLKNKVCWICREIKQDQCLYSNSSLQLQKECSICESIQKYLKKKREKESVPGFLLIKEGILVLFNHMIYGKGFFF